MSGPIVVWYVCRYSNAPERKEYIGETKHFYVKSGWDGRPSKTKKVDSFGEHYPTEEQALAVIAARTEREAESRRMKRIRDAAPELLEALQDAVTSTDYDMAPPHPWVKDARAAIAKATGE